MEVRDSFGTILQDEDSVASVKDLKVLVSFREIERDTVVKTSNRMKTQQRLTAA